MELADIRSRLRAVIFFITSFIILFFILRILLEYFDVVNSGFSSIIYSISNFFLSPFIGLVNINLEGVLDKINFDGVVAIIFYLLFSIAISEVLTSFFFNTFKDIFQNFLDALYKFVEAFLFLRIVLELFGIGISSTSPYIITLVYTTTQWSQGNLFEINFLNGRIDLSAILVLIVVIVMDIYTERVVDRLILIFGGTSKLSSEYFGKISFPKFSFKNLPKIKPPRLSKKNIPDKVIETKYGDSTPISDDLIKDVEDSIKDMDTSDKKE